MKKLLLSITPVLVLAAFVVMPAMASAATTAYGTCTVGETQEHPPCGENEKTFVPFANGTSVKVESDKANGTGNFILESTAGIIQCEGLKDFGTVENVAGVGHSKETLLFHGCFTEVEKMKCKVFTTGAGAGVVLGTVTNEVLTETTVKITIASGFEIKFAGRPPAVCPVSGTAIGTVTGSATGTQATGSNTLGFAKATGLKLGTAAATLTGSDELFTEAGKPVFIN